MVIGAWDCIIKPQTSWLSLCRSTMCNIGRTAHDLFVCVL